MDGITAPGEDRASEDRHTGVREMKNRKTPARESNIAHKRATLMVEVRSGSVFKEGSL